jgi:tetratricopeptide (TPR) repeat protein
VKAYNNRGFAYFNKGNQDGAIADFSEMIRLDPADAVTYLNRGFAYEDKGELRAALADFRKATALDPTMRTRAGALAAESIKRVEQAIATGGGAK